MKNAEFLTTEEQQQLKDLQAKQKRIKRAQQSDLKFLLEADQRKDELLERWGIRRADTQDFDLIEDTEPLDY